MYRGDSEVIEVQAFDSTDNVFTTLEGLRFGWDITSAQKDVSPVLTMVHFRDSDVDGMRYRDDKGFHGDSVLVRAMRTGRADVTVRLSENGLESVRAATAKMTVLDPIHLRPYKPLYLLPATEFQYTLLVKEDSALHPVPMPSSRYFWGSTNTSCVGVDRATGRVWGVAPGTADIFVRDVDMAENEARGVVHVVTPSYLEIGVTALTQPSDSCASPAEGSWYLVHGRPYQISVGIFDRSGNRVTNTDETVFSVTVNGGAVSGSFFHVVNASDNGAEYGGTAVGSGTAVVAAAISRVENERSGQVYSFPVPLQAQVDATITAPLAVSPATVILPWDEQFVHHATLAPSGGSGAYTFWSRSESVASVDEDGVVTTHSEGSGVLCAADTHNTANAATINVDVTRPVSIAFVPSVSEVEVGASLALPLAVYDATHRLFTNASAVPVRYAIADTSVFSLGTRTQSTNPAASQDVYLPAHVAGSTTVRALLGVARTERTVVAFEPLRVVDAHEGATLVSLGSAWDFIFEGGPLPWMFEPSSFFRSFEVAKASAVRVTEVSEDVDASLNSARYRVTCLAYGEQTIEYSVGNHATESNPFPAVRRANVTFACRSPHKVELRLADAHHNSEACGRGRVTSDGRRMHRVRNGRTVTVTALVHDNTGRVFHNHTSLDLKWESTNERRARFAAEGEADGERDLVLSSEEGTVGVSVTAVTYDIEVLNEVGLTNRPLTRDPAASLTDGVELDLLRNIELVPHSAVLLHHPDSSIVVNARGGSGRIEFRINDTEVAALAVQPDSHGQAAQITALRPGTVAVTAEDLCLEGSTPAVAVVRVAEPAAIIIRGLDKVQVGSSIDLEVEVVDALRAPLPFAQYRVLDLTPLIGDDDSAIDLQPKEDSHSLYTVKGLSVATASVSFTARLPSGAVITSEAHEIDVFAPMALVPHEVRLVCGAGLQLHPSGGPHAARVDILWRSDDARVASVDSHGVVTGRGRGTTRIHATAKSGDVVHARASAEVTVGTLRGVVIVGGPKVAAGTDVTLRVEGSDGESPLAFASARVSYVWSNTDPGVASLAPPQEADFSVALRARAAGQTTVRVVVHVHPDCSPASEYPEARYEASVVISVVEPLALIVPGPCDNSLLLPFGSTMCINTNRDRSKQLKYSVLGGDPVADVSPVGCVTARAASGTTHVLVEDRSADEAVVVTVHVRPLHALSLEPVTNDIYELPVGSAVSVRVVLRDSMWRPFSTAQGVALDVLPSRGDVVRVSHEEDAAGRQTVLVKGVHQGDAVVKVSLHDQPYVADYARVHVGEAISPSAPVLHVGSTCHFSARARGDVERAWSSSDPSVLRVDAVTGVAVALKPGQTTVYVERDGDSTYTQVTVVRAGGVHVDVTVPFVTNAVVAGAVRPEYVFPLTFLAEDGHELRSVGRVRHNITFQCAIKERLLAHATERTEAGGEACVVVPVLNPVGSLSAPPQHLNLSVTVTDADGGHGHSWTVPVPYHPAFRVSQREAALTREAPSAVVQVRGRVAGITASSSDPRVEVRARPSQDDSAVMFDVSLADAASGAGFDAVVSFVDAATGQRETVAVTRAAPHDPQMSASRLPDMPPITAPTPAPHIPYDDGRNRSGDAPASPSRPEDERSLSRALVILAPLLIGLLLILCCCRSPGPAVETVAETPARRPITSPDHAPTTDAAKLLGRSEFRHRQSSGFSPFTPHDGNRPADLTRHTPSNLTPFRGNASLMRSTTMGDTFATRTAGTSPFRATGGLR